MKDARDRFVWHGASPDEACARLGVDPGHGLDADEVERRRAEAGPNKLAEAKKEPGWHAFLRQYRDLMQLVLVGAAVVSMTIANRRFVQMIGAALVLTFLVTELSPLQRIFDTVSLTTSQWGVCFLGPVVYVALVELGKLVDRHVGRRELAPAPAET